MSMDIKYSWSNIQDVNPSHDKVLFCFDNYSSSFTRIGEGIKVQGQIQGHKWTIWYLSKYWFMSILIWWRTRPIGKKKNDNSLVGGQCPDPLPRIWVCVHKVSIVCGNMWDSPQGFPPIPPLHSSTAGEWVGGETMWSPLRPCTCCAVMPPCWAEFHWLFHRRTTLQPHWSTARPKQTTTEVPSPSGGSSFTWKADTKICTKHLKCTWRIWNIALKH